jgi:preprotein translocase subunit SecG
MRRAFENVSFAKRRASLTSLGRCNGGVIGRRRRRDGAKSSTSTSTILAEDRADGNRLPESRRNRYAEPMETVLSVLEVIFAVIVVFLVLMHSGKDAGLSGAFGVGSGTGPLGGGSMVERNLNRWTVFFSVLFVINAVILLKRPWA